MRILLSFAVCLSAVSACLADWKSQLPRPVFDEKPELVELYAKTWEIAQARIDTLPGIPVPRYMDEGHRSDWIWIWDTCFMVHFCKYLPQEFPGVDSLGNFYGILMSDEKLALPKVLGNRWSCGRKGLSEPWEGRMLVFMDEMTCPMVFPTLRLLNFNIWIMRAPSTLRWE